MWTVLCWISEKTIRQLAEFEFWKEETRESAEFWEEEIKRESAKFWKEEVKRESLKFILVDMNMKQKSQYRRASIIPNE
jgi:hypothetical protein